MKYLRSSRIYFEDGVRDGYLVINKDKIVGFLNKEAAVEDFEDYKDQRIIPGIFDTHNHGTYGYGDSDMAGKPDEIVKADIRHYLHALAYEGVANIFPTETDTLKQVAMVAKEGYDNGAHILGIQQPLAIHITLYASLVENLVEFLRR